MRGFQIIKKVILLVFIILNSINCKANNVNITNIFISHFDKEIEINTTINAISSIEGHVILIPIVHHISRTDNGDNPVTTLKRIKKIMGDINRNFKSSNIQFYTKSIEFIDNTTWNKQFIKQDDFINKKVLKNFEDDKALNIFYFFKIGNRRNGVIKGTLGATALFPNQGNNIKLSLSATAIENTGTITHEIGHYLGLFHTSDDFEDSKGDIELVDGSNCKEAGDKICDTPASPPLNNTNIDKSNCTYIGNEKDANGMHYKPDTFNFMIRWKHADSSGAICRRKFTPGQSAKMISIIKNDRPYLITK